MYLVIALILLFQSCQLNKQSDIPQTFLPYITNSSTPVEYIPILPQYDRDRQPMPESISQEAALVDIAMLEYIFNTSYSGYEYWKVKGVNFNQFFNNLRKIVNKQDTINTYFFEKEASKILKQLSDGHIAIEGYGYNYARGHKSVYYCDVIVEKSPENRYKVIDSKNERVSVGDYFTQKDPEKYLYPTLSSKGKSHFLLGAMSYDYIHSQKLSFNGSDLDISFHESRLLHHFPFDPKPFYIYDVKNIPVLRINSLRNTLYPLMKEFMESGHQLKNEDLLIIDVMNNGGGSSAFAQNFIKNLNGTVNWKLEVAELMSPPLTEYFAKYQTLSSDTHSPQYLELIQRYSKYYESFKETPIKKWQFSTTGDIEERGTFEGKLIVLANRGVISGGEALVGSSESIKNRILIGENTGGAGQFSSNCNYYLPNSKIIVRLPRHFIFIQGFEESVGYMPDYWLDTEDPFNEVIKWITDPENYCFKYQSSYTDMLKNKQNNIVLPDDVKILKPKPNIANELSKFSGRWFGLDGGVLEHVLVVEKITASNNIEAIYAWGNAPQWGVESGWMRMIGYFENGKLILEKNDIKIIYTLKPDRTMISLFEKPGVIAEARLIKMNE